MKHIQSATEEILIIFSTANAFYRQCVLRGVMRLCKEAASERNVKTRILTPKDDRIHTIVQELLQEQRQEEQHLQQQRGRIDIRYIEPSLQTRVTVPIIDRKYCFIVELKDDSKDNSDWLLIPIANQPCYLVLQSLKVFGDKLSCMNNPRTNSMLQKMN